MERNLCYTKLSFARTAGDTNDRKDREQILGMQIELPERFLESMKALLGEEYGAWLASYDSAPYQGMRINRTKTEPREWEKIAPFPVRQVPWCPNGYYVPGEVRTAKHPYYYAGLYYIQEPSAMAPASVLPVEPGDKVLDLCAAPGGKSTELGARLEGEGLLISNDISHSRARALLKNLELFGISNICVTSETPEKLADTFGMYFDKILVDAPCSGEGMFRKDPDLIRSWMEHGPEYYAQIQKDILSQAVRMLKPGGFLLYSTCTFARQEDEDTVCWLLNTAPELELVPIPLWEGACRGVCGEPVIRLFPHKTEGEGHFLALLHKRAAGVSQAGISQEGVSKGAEDGCRGEKKTSPEVLRLEAESDFLTWEKDLAHPLERERLMVKDGAVYYLPRLFEKGWNLRYLRTGLLVGEWKKQRFEPSQALAMALQKREFRNTVSFSCEDERTVRYLKGETVFLTDGEQTQTKKGWCLVCVDQYPLGWAKCTGNSLKNKYYPGWRWQ